VREVKAEEVIGVRGVRVGVRRGVKEARGAKRVSGVRGVREVREAKEVMNGRIEVGIEMIVENGILRGNRGDEGTKNGVENMKYKLVRCALKEIITNLNSI